MKYLLGAALMAALVVPLSSAQADPPPWAPAHGKRAKDRAIYDSYGRYYEPRRIGYDDYVWRGRDGQYYCRRDNGTNGRSEEHTSELQYLMRNSYPFFCLQKKYSTINN